jgi:hypothetical protein
MVKKATIGGQTNRGGLINPLALQGYEGVMATNWEETFRFWGRSPSETERTKCENAERAIRKAIAADPTLSGKNIAVFAQGSYRNRVNVRFDSDVDICVCCKDVIFPAYPDSAMTLSSVNLIPATYSYAEFKNDVETALVAYFGRSHITRGNKAFDVHENTYRIDSDVVAAFEHRRYTTRDMYGRWAYLEGTQFYPDQGGEVINWPEQQYANGVSKNEKTGKRYKAMARILKTLRNQMDQAGIEAAKPMASFLLECLAFNVPNLTLFTNDSYVVMVREALIYLYEQTTTLEKCSEWGEVSELKWLFRGPQPWTYQQANVFIVAAWNFVGFAE